MSLKFVEVLIILGAGVLFVGWQLRDLRLSREKTRQQGGALEAAPQVIKSTDGSGPEASHGGADGS